MKLNVPYGLSRWVAIGSPRQDSRAGSGGRRCRPLTDTEDHELRGLGRGHPDDANQATVVQVVLSHGRGVALDVEALLGLGAEQCARFPFIEQETRDGVPNRVPEGWAVYLEDHPLGALVDRLRQVVEVPAHVEVLPLRVIADGARAPDQ